MDADHGYISSSADFLGRCTIYLNSIKCLSNAEDDIPLPEWYDIKFGTDDKAPVCGQVLCSFAISEQFPEDITSKPAEMNRMVEKLDFDVFVNCLGLRELQSIGLLPVQKPFVSYMIKSLMDPKQCGGLENVTTQPGPYGPNPNLNTVVKFVVPLPTAELYCPSLSCTVYDQVFLGLSQPIIGTFSIPLGKIMQECNKENRDLIQNAKAILFKLKAKLDSKLAQQAVDEDDIELEVADNT